MMQIYRVSKWKISNIVSCKNNQFHSIPREYMSAQIHSIKVEAWYNIVQKRSSKDQNSEGRKYSNWQFLSTPCALSFSDFEYTDCTAG